MAHHKIYNDFKNKQLKPVKPKPIADESLNSGMRVRLMDSREVERMFFTFIAMLISGRYLDPFLICLSFLCQF